MELRQRKVPGKSEPEKEASSPEKKTVEATQPQNVLANSFWLTRIVFLRGLAFIYGVAFLVAWNQNKELIGDRGLLPAKAHLKVIKDHFASPLDRWLHAPTLLWLWEPWEDMQTDALLDAFALTGALLSAVILWTGAANMVALTTLWVLYHSIVNVGQAWYSFGWESQLLETGFLAIFMVPVACWKAFPAHVPSPWLAVAGYRWLITRIMLGAGLIKIRGDQCWRDFTCMDYFFETQPNPNPQAYFAHQAPLYWHRFEVFGNHVVELVLPWLTFLPFWRWPALVNGFWQVVFQVVLISTGNLAFLNWLTILPAIWYFDDLTLSSFFGSKTLSERQKVVEETKNGSHGGYKRARQGLSLAVGCLIAYLSVPIVSNLVSSRQIMNTSFEPFRIVNTYGAFGSVTKDRTEIIFEATASRNPNAPDSEWMEYEFKCKPGSISRRPCLISPYHYRLDWLMWFAAFQNYQHNPWLLHLAGKMLDNDPVVDSLLAHNPFRGGPPPRFVRAKHYQYHFTELGNSEGNWWRRQQIGDYLPILDKRALKPIYEQFQWTFADKPKKE